MSYLAGKDVTLLLSARDYIVPESLFINIHSLKPPKVERESVIRTILQDCKQRHQFLDGDSWVDYLLGKIEEVEPNNRVWPMSVVIQLSNARALQHMGYISEEEMINYAAKD